MGSTLSVCSRKGNFISADRQMRKKLPLRGTTSPAPGEDVTAGDKRGNLASRSDD